MKKYFLFVIAVLIIRTGVSQTDSAKVSSKMERVVGFNMTGLASELIPFNAINPLTTGPVNIFAKFFVNNLGYRLGFGANLADFSSQNENVHLNIRNGYEIRKKINENWGYSHGCDMLISFGNLNLPGNTSDNSDIMVGIAPFWGVEYRLSKFVSISTETSLLIGLSEGFGGASPRLQFIPPIALFLNLNH